ncbi:bifunctional serine/threonine-protein kinase/formylglycine-generating enzyme family protein [Dendronalium sp. ChiSLP03b]|uniref:bifunctional serine/threonine-protein kinase/formylglycine-generating enzyme family protein n=1 Tax=Dendronalium sp. ChiSLP03b TaxID=3075381 RepID=UPI002AD555D4|nr:bifunctional serine/threonine-protein kinase/formylglycine-generating enzyme family protein [Dendronalium sp. ChiSLP03b]MDZ8206243.1 bifunctional serine/threonine-protein kinase/formylglycine-generating enzyme family protein [Dendronalium sp. ChiSLP03b]
MPTTGTVLRNRYKIIKILGSGGFGDTYLAEDLDLPNHPKCVVKHLKPNSDPAVLQIVRRLFDSEAQVLYCLGNDSDQIPRLFAHFEEQGEFYLVQEFIDGEDLSHEISSGKRLTEKEVIKLLQEILEVLAVVHKKNIIHRDIKTQNIMRRRQDSKIVLIDFGAVKEVNTLMVNAQGQTSVSVTIGTAGYMPSEQAAGQPKLCSDVYAVGMLGIYAVTGLQPHELPKDPTNGEIIWRNWANVSEKLAEVLSKMVSYHFRDRYPSAVEALQALTLPQPQRRQPPPPPAPKPPQPTPNLSRRRTIQTIGWTVAGISLALIGERLLSLFSSGESTNKTPVTNEPLTQTPTSSNSLQTFQFETVTVDAQGRITNRPKREAKYFVEDLGNSVTLEMVQIPGGTFTMGSPAGEEKRYPSEGPQHLVKVPGFFMGKYEITQAQYQAIMGTNPSNFKGEKRPVENVSWNDAVEFCKKLSQKTGKTYRLPSEAEWEYACRAGTTTPFYFGETITTNLANYQGTDFTFGSTTYSGNYSKGPKGQYRKETTEVGSFPPNAFGLYDMHGNVWEWCQDFYHKNYNGAPTDGSAWLNDNDNKARLLRGGCWLNSPDFCRSAYRVRLEADLRGYVFGFRVVVVSA